MSDLVDAATLLPVIAGEFRAADLAVAGVPVEATSCIAIKGAVLDGRGSLILVDAAPSALSKVV